MTHNELWLSYHQISRSHKPATTHLIELEFQNQKLVDLEDVLEHLFRQGFIEARHRPVSFWENHDGKRIHAGQAVEELLKDGAGKCPQTALRLVIADAIPTVWFSYHYLHKPATPVVTQRVKLDVPETKFELIAQLSNHIFHSGYLPAHLRTKVWWQGSCGRKIEEYELLETLLEAGDGVSETACLRLNIDHVPEQQHHHHHHHHHHKCPVPCH